MKLLLFSDIHNDDKSLKRLEKKAKKADALVCAGDFTFFEQGMKKVLKKMDSWGKPVMLVHGNHEEPEKTRKECEKLGNIEFIHKKVHRTGKYSFIGHGGEGFALESKDFDRFAARLKFRKGEKLILVTHQPPHRTRLDFIWAHHGNKSYRKFIAKKRPLLAVCGHLHETAGMEDKIGRTRVINAGERGILTEV